MKNDTEEVDYIETHSTDSSIFKVIPRQVIFPKNEIERAVRLKENYFKNK
jgi:hypothetical protein